MIIDLAEQRKTKSQSIEAKKKVAHLSTEALKALEFKGVHDKVENMSVG